MRSRLLQQMLFWCLLWTVAYQMNRGPDFSYEFLYRMFFLAPGIALVIYVNTSVLLPRLYFSRQYLWYALAGLLLIGVLSRLILLLHPAFEQETQLRTGMFKAGFLAVPLAVSLIGNALYEVSLYAKGKEQETIALHTEKLEAEMKFLKSQINPHFLFNALNNIYTQTLLKSEDAPENLLRLSAMLRYVLYECSAAYVPLRKELDYIRNYVDLFRLKDSAGINIQMDLDDTRPERMIAPLLFVPLIENAFKHSGIEKIGKGWVAVTLRNSSGELLFVVKNSLDNMLQTKDKTGGIGLNNVRRQLELAYPDKHEFQVSMENNTFEVQLKLLKFHDPMSGY